MEMLLSQTEQLPSLLAVSRSRMVQSWDPTTLTRALNWGHFFRHLHSRLRAQPTLREALKQHLKKKSLVRLSHLKRCPELLGLALLENPALSSTTRHSLFCSFLISATGGAEPFISLLARRRAASELLALLEPPIKGTAGIEQWKGLPVRVQAQMLVSQLQGDGDGDGNQGRPSSALLDSLPCGSMLYRVVAVALMEPDGEEKAKKLLLPWLLFGDPARLLSFCRFLSPQCLASLCAHYSELLASYLSFLSSWGNCLIYDPLHGKWQTSGVKEDEVPWEEMQDRISCLYQESEPLGSAVQTWLRQLKAQDGNFEVRGLSIWTDILLDMEMPHFERKLNLH
ncbi:Fanconi anemia group F protein [Notechis scutatus]|uniref:Fanconi anemia group F protein n=1 Tax=Notechis scutatus TaxID=8663 RepID=A0A6J1US23_9SAUR|nr:Fanconi anemia group F protein [Notechis scutatus]